MTNKNKKSVLSKIIKWTSISFLVVIIMLISIPFLFKNKIKSVVENTINKNINAQVTFKEINLSFLKNFPHANLGLNQITVVNKEPFLGDTLFKAKEVNLKMSIFELFKNADESMNLKSFSIEEGQINIIVNKNGKGNYDISKEYVNEINTTTTNTLSLNIKEYAIHDLDFCFFDETSKMKVFIDHVFHSGKGNFVKEVLDLDTKSTAKLSLEMENVRYMNNVPISLDAIIGIDLKESKYTFKKNTGYINQLPLEFNGFIQLIDENQLFNIDFKTPSSSFKNLLSLLPKQYAGNLSTIKTAGDFIVKGIVNGVNSKEKIPTFNISFASKNAMFKYADLPKAVDNIYIDSKIINKTGALNDTYIEVEKLTFKIDQDAFFASAYMRNLVTNPTLKLNAKGTVNLENISNVYPISLETKLSGILKANISTALDMNSIEKKRYENIQNSGTLSLRGFKYDDKEVAKPFFIDNTTLSFTPNTIKLTEFTAKTGASDLKIKGNLENFYGFIFKNQELKGNFILNSNTLKVTDFLTEETTETTEKTGSLKIPSFLNCTFSANAKTVLYDNLNLSNVSGKLVIKNETINLQDLKLEVFGGNIGMNGKISTKEKVSNFSMDVNLKEINISDSFSQLEVLQSIAPIAKTIEGKLNSTLKLSGNLSEDMTPVLSSISGNLLGQLLDTKLKASNSKILNAVGSKVDFLDITKLNLNETSALFTFDNGQVSVKPFNINYNDIGITIGGNHGFDNVMNYDLTFEVPVKYLGSEVTNLLSKLTPKEAKKIKSIPVKGNLNGSFSSPNFSINMKDATSNLIKDLVEKQKKHLIDGGKDKLINLLIGNKKETTKTKGSTKGKINGILSNLFKKKKKDTVN